MKFEIRERHLLLLLLVVIGIALCVSATSRGLLWDEAHHANPALFLYNTIKDSPQDIVSYAVDYHTHYKFFAVFASYPPMNMMLLGSAYSALGPGILVTRLVAIIESLIMLFFVFKLAKLYSRGNRYLPFICVIFAALHPVVFLYSASNMLDIGLTMFMVASAYFFVQYLRTEKRSYLFGTAIALALGIMTKVPMVLFLIPLLLTMIFERRLYLFRKHGRDMLKALVIFIIFLLPFLIQLGVLYSNGLFDVFAVHWDRPSGMNPLESVLITRPEIVESSLGVLFYQWFLVPFFIAGLYLMLKRRRDIDKLFLFTIVFLFWFYTSNIIWNLPDPRFILPIVPFFVIAACHPLAELGEWLDFRRLKLIVAGVLIVIAGAQACSYYALINYFDIPNLNRAAVFVIEDADEPTTVLTTWGQPQMFEFARLDSERKIYTMYMPEQEEDIIRAVNGDFSYYQSKEWWDKFGIEHPNPDYVILHEKVLREKGDTYDYDLSYFEDNPEFELLKIIEGNEPFERIFIYKIVH